MKLFMAHDLARSKRASKTISKVINKVCFSMGICVLLFFLALTSMDAHAATINFTGKLDVVMLNAGGGVYSSTPIGTDFTGLINDNTGNGSITDGITTTNFGCCIAAGGLSVSNNDVLDADTAALLNTLAGSNMFNAGDLVDGVNIEGDTTTSGGGRIEVGLSYIFAANTFSNNSLDNYPFDPNAVLISLFFIYEENSVGGDVYSAVGKLAPPLISVPNVVGLTQSAAVSAIVAEGLSVGTITTQNSNSVPVGNVISQSPVAGTEVSPSSEIDLVISLGVQPLANSVNIINMLSSLLLDDDPIIEECIIDISGEWVISNSTPAENWENSDQLIIAKENGCDFVGYADWDASKDWPVYLSTDGTIVEFLWKTSEEETINATGTIIGDTMGGSYNVIGGPDDGEVGQWKVRKGELIETFNSLKIFAKSGGAYEIWGGEIDYLSEPNWYEYYYSIDQTPGYTLFASAVNGGVLEVFDNYPYYVIAVPIQVEIDAVLVTKDIYINSELVGENQIFLEKGNHSWGNVDSYLSPNYDLMGLNLLGAPDNNYSFVGSDPYFGTTSGTHQGFIIVFNK